MANRSRSVGISDLGAADRIFHIDRDTYIIYTGLHEGDIRPFTRVGVSSEIPVWLPHHVENVILPQESPYNAGLEIAWVRAALASGEKEVRYVGSQERVVSLYNFAGMPQIASQQQFPPLQAVPYGPPRSRQTLVRDRAHCSFFAQGNFIVEVGAHRTFDYFAARRSALTIDREYDLLSKALAKSPHSPCSQPQGYSFIWLGGRALRDFLGFAPSPGRSPGSSARPRPNPISSRLAGSLQSLKNGSNSPAEGEASQGASNGAPAIYWNLKGRGLLLNPPADYHHALFENYIDPKRVDMVISSSPRQPGFVEAVRRKDAVGGDLGVYIENQERLNTLRRLYKRLVLKPFAEEASLPMIREVGFFPSRNGSHALFSWRFAPGKDKITQLLFPLAIRRPRKGFEFLRPPHDLEIEPVRSSADFRDSRAHIRLQFPAGIGLRAFLRRRLSSGAYPLVPGREYKIQQALKIEELLEAFLSCFQAEEYSEELRRFAFLNLGLDFSLEKLHAGLGFLRGIPIPRHDPILRHNLSQFLQYIALLPMYRKGYGHRERRILDRLSQRFSLRWSSYRHWLEIGRGAVSYQLLFAAGRASFLLLKRDREEPPAIRLPFSFEQLEAQPKAYGPLLRLWNRQADRSERRDGYRPIIDALEKLYDEKIELLQNRIRLRSFIEGLGLSLWPPPTARQSFWWESMKERLRSLARHLPELPMPQLPQLPQLPALYYRSLRSVGALLLAVLLLTGGIGAIYAIASLFSSGGSSEITERGDSAAEIKAVQLVAPGSLQGEEDVPGAETVSPTAQEIWQYVNALAEQNNFRPLGATSPTNGLRDPDLIFPGDLLRLPDSRLARVEKGNHVWNIAREHYRLDYARLRILERQVEALLSNAASDLEPEMLQDIEKKQALMTRLAITSGMRRLLSRVDKRIERVRPPS